MVISFTMESENLSYEKDLEWKIHHFSKLGIDVESPPFSPLPKYSTKWLLRLEFTPEIDGKNLMQVMIKSLAEADMTPLRVIGFVKLDNVLGQTWFCKYIRQIITSNSTSICCTVPSAYRICHGVLPQSIEKYIPLPNDELIVTYSLTISGDIKSVIIQDPFISIDEYDKNVLKAVYNQNSFTNCVFLCDGKEIKAHKAVLSAKSPVFSKMFLERQHENISTFIIKDFSPCVFEGFIMYVYTKDINIDVKSNLNKLLSLYKLANVYCVEDLKRFCSNLLISKFLNTRTAYAILKIFDVFKDKEPRTSTTQYLTNRFMEVAETSEWKNFMETDTKLAIEIVRSVALNITRRRTLIE